MAYVYRNPHFQSLLSVRQELQQRMQERKQIERRIIELQEAEKALAPLVGQSDQDITDSLPRLCLRVMSLAPKHGFSAPEIRDGLKLMGVEVPGKNPLGVIHTCIGRMSQSGYISTLLSAPGEPMRHVITEAGILMLQNATP